MFPEAQLSKVIDVLLCLIFSAPALRLRMDQRVRCMDRRQGAERLVQAFGWAVMESDGLDN